MEPRLVNAVDIAVSRLGPRQKFPSFAASMTRTIEYLNEVQKAKGELARGEWILEAVSPTIGTAA